ncbi:hypothetical protein C8F04DRAFT_1237675 [Mycena alexandri]|uniref:Uncharacterized protein n=1 Tax=Mycena alexandri TaxID=1745969 RepID=A0AAD6X0Z8_9AGAR|nr:hypothetical protein C8F04DRAFT_1237675 [Mycena alexandri]
MAKGNKARKSRVARGRGKGASSRFVDDEAADSDDGVLVEAECVQSWIAGYRGETLTSHSSVASRDNSEGYNMVPNEADLAFIDDHGSVNPSKPEGKGTARTKQKARRVSGSVIDIQDSSDEEDLTAMAVDDRVFALIYALHRLSDIRLKASTLPSPLATRSTSKARVGLPEKGIIFSDDKEKDLGQASDQTKQPDAVLPFQMDPEQLLQFNAWMAMKNGGTALEPSARRSSVRGMKTEEKEDADKATLRSRRPTTRALRQLSPDWDLPLGISEQPEASKGKKRTSSARKRAATDSDEDTDIESRREKVSMNRASRPIGTYMDPPSVPNIEGMGDNRKGLTMAQFFSGKSVAKQDEEVEASKDEVLLPDGQIDDSVNGSDTEPPSTVFLEDLDTYKAYFDPRAPCGVNDPELQDPVLAPGYADLHPLPRGGREVLPAFEPQGMAFEDTGDFKGGRVNFSSWKRHLKHMLADNSIGALVFKEAEPNFINPSRVSPLRLSRQASPGSNPTYRLLVGTRIATCVSALFCSESVIVEAAKIGAKSERMRKWVSGIFHNQEWERFEALMCLVFGEQTMYSQITPKKAVAFQTMISPETTGVSKDTDIRFAASTPADMFTPVVSKSPSKKPGTPKAVIKSKTLLAYNDPIPVYDARKVVLDFQADLGRLDQVLPRFAGEIPFSSFIVVGYTASSYQAARSGSTEKVAQLGCNVLWVIVCGTPVLRKK